MKILMNEKICTSENLFTKATDTKVFKHNI